VTLPAARLVVLALATIAISACVSETVRSVDMTPPQQATDSVPEGLLLDVGVGVFAANVPDDYDVQIEQNISPEIRRAEGNFIAYTLKNMLQSTGNWGAVRVVPRPTNAVDVLVGGTILNSDGARLQLEVTVMDASGSEWFKRKYESLSSKYAYDPSVPRNIDPFQSIYKQISDDMQAYRATFTEADVTRIRTIAEMVFARDFAPDAFASYVDSNKKGQITIKRLPAPDDPMLARIQKVREREYVFVDTLDEYFAEYQRTMYPPYQGWRQASYEEAISYRQLQAQARARAIAGTVALIGGIAAQASDNSTTQTAGTLGIIAGAMTIKSAFAKRAEAKIHSEVLQELGASAEADISPHSIELENETVRLTGTVDAQYSELRRILRRIYYQELGLALPEALPEIVTETATPTPAEPASVEPVAGS
jgi:hypothetical protein